MGFRFRGVAITTCALLAACGDRTRLREPNREEPDPECSDLELSACSYGYSGWSAPGACSATCGAGTQLRARLCLRSDGAVTGCELCGGECEETSACTSTSGCVYAYSAWSSWSGCSEGQQQRVRSCQRQDGEEADCALCGGGCLEARSCAPCANFGVNAVDCSPNVPGNKAACDQVLLGRRDACVAAGCAWFGPTSCAIGGSASNTSCYGARAECR
jgi:hypothetical protein